MCVKPPLAHYYDLFEYEEYSEDMVSSVDVNTEVEEYVEYRTYELYQKDFNDGTYRILQPGYYKIMEDIIFDFNAPDGWDGINDNLETYNDLHDWYPSEDYDDITYEFSFGYFAGIFVSHIYSLFTVFVDCIKCMDAVDCV